MFKGFIAVLGYFKPLNQKIGGVDGGILSNGYEIARLTKMAKKCVNFSLKIL
jgi:hypothetical protein